MNCSAHPTRTGVAQCNRCNRALCKECSDRCINTDDKYVGLCDVCVMAVGINCSYHPSQKAVTRCGKCGKFICGDCFDGAWDGVCDVDSSDDTPPGCYCHACVGEVVDHESTVNWGYFNHIVKKGMIWVLVPSALGLIIGLATQISGGGDAGAIFGGAWLGIGIGCCVQVLLSIPKMVFAPLKRYCSAEGRGYDSFHLSGALRAFFVDGLLGSLIFGLLLCFVGAITGPLIPLIYIAIRQRQLKKIGAMMERTSKLGATLRKAHTMPDDSATKAEIHQGAATFLADIKLAARFQKPVLWFWV